MDEKGKSFSVIQLNSWSETGWGVVDDASGALVHLDGLALKLTRERATLIAQQLNAGVNEAPDNTVLAQPSEIERDEH